MTMQVPYLQVLVMLHAAFAATFFFLDRQAPSPFARLLAASWLIESVRAAILLPWVNAIGGMTEHWFALSDLLCFAANWCLLAGCADLAKVRLPSWLMPAYFWSGAPVVLFNRYLLAPLCAGIAGWEPEQARFHGVLLNLVLMFVPVAATRMAVLLWLFRVWRRTRQPGALIASAFCVPYALVALAVPVQFYFTYNPEWVALVWCARVLGFSIGLVMLMLNLQQLAGARSEASLAAAQALAKIGSWEYDAVAKAATWSAGMFELYERPAADGVMSYPEFLAKIHPDDREGFKRGEDRALREQRNAEHEFRIVRRDGSVRWIHGRNTNYFDEAGRLVRQMGVEQDVTERKELEARFLRAQRLEAVGTLASGIAHDINNILAPMLTASSLLKEAAGSPHDRKLLEMMEASARRGADIIRQLLTFSRGVDGVRAPLQIRHLIAEVGNIVRETFPREIMFVSGLGRDLWPVVGDATQLHQVLVNLCVNARDAMPRGGTLTVAAANVEVDAAKAAGHAGAKAGPHVVVTIADTGTGIKPEVVERIFDPFFTTKEVGKGTGLGLSTALGIVRSHGGFITVDSECGRGSSFRIYLPALPEAAHAPAGETGALLRGGAGELILVVDDEEAIRTTMRRLLERHNYRVCCAANGRQAIEVFLSQPEAVKLVLTDVMMREMDGVALVRALRVISPELRFVVTSGMESTEMRAEFEACGIVEILPKPCPVQTLLDAINREIAAIGETFGRGVA